MSTTTQITINDLTTLLEKYLQDTDIEQVDRAWQFACDTYKGREHFSGRSYLSHLVDVTFTLASMYLEVDTIISGMMSGALQNGVSVEELQEKFGSSVATIVRDSDRVSNIQYNSKFTHQAEDTCNLLLTAANNNQRALLVNLTSRLHDMRSLDLVAPETSLKIALETRDLYVPLATQFGINWMKREFEDLSFRFLHPDKYFDLSERINRALPDRQQYIDKMIVDLQKALLEAEESPIRIIGEPQHLYGIYKKYIASNIPLERIDDKVVFVIIVEYAWDCYETLEIIRANWAPAPEGIKDFIGMPGQNGYQAIHITVADSENHFFEVRIFTEKMYRGANDGIAAYLAHEKFRVQLDKYVKQYGPSEKDPYTCPF